MKIKATPGHGRLGVALACVGIAFVGAMTTMCGTAATTLGRLGGDGGAEGGPCGAGRVECFACGGGSFCSNGCPNLSCPAPNDSGSGGDSGNACPAAMPALCSDCNGGTFCAGDCVGLTCPTDAGAMHDAGPSADATSLDASSARDASADVQVFGPDGACACHPYWCGCGVCAPSQIACTTSTAVCARGCNSSCTELPATTCGCDSQGRCMRTGVDAAAVGCFATQDCPPADCCVPATAADITGTCVAAPNAACM